MNHKEIDYLFKKHMLNSIYKNDETKLLEKEIDRKINYYHNTSFRQLRRWNVQLEILYGLMWVKNITITDLAEEIECSNRTLQRYIFEGYRVPEERKEAISEVLKTPKNILFFDEK
jgi:hypothetical protein